MEELLKYRKRIITNFVFLLILSVISVFLILWASKFVFGQGAAITLLSVFLIQVPLILGLGFNSIRAINNFLEIEEKRRAIKTDEIEQLEKEVEVKAKEADDLSFNINRLNDDLGKFSDWESFGNALLTGISKQIEIVVGMVYRYDSDEKKYFPVANYAYYSEVPPTEFREGDGLSGQVVKDKKAMFINELPEGYVKVMSGLGSHKPRFLAIIPFIADEQVLGVIELATFKPMERGLSHKSNEIAEFIGKKASTIIM